MKSIYFNQAPTMNGKLTMRYTDITVENFKPKIEKALAEKQMATLCEDVDDLESYTEMLDYAPPSWDCDICDWQEEIGEYRPHTHYID